MHLVCFLLKALCSKLPVSEGDNQLSPRPVKNNEGFFLPSSLKNILLLILLLKMFYMMIESVFCSEMSVMGAVLLAQVNMQIWGSSSGLGSQSRAPQFRNSFSICT